MEQPSPTTDSKQLQENMERAISQAAAAAAAAQEDTGPETLLDAVRTHTHTSDARTLVLSSDDGPVLGSESLLKESA